MGFYEKFQIFIFSGSGAKEHLYFDVKFSIRNSKFHFSGGEDNK